MADIIVPIFNALFYASLLFLIASGLSLTFGVLKILNFFHGSLFALGAYITVSIVRYLIGINANPIMFFIAPVAAAALVGLLGLAVEPTLIRPMYKRDVTYQLLLTFGILLMLEDAQKMLWGVKPLTASNAYMLLGALRWGNTLYPTYNLFFMIIAFIVGLLMWFFISKTRGGRIITATASDREMASCLGVNVSSTFTRVFMIGAILGGLGGGYIIPAQAITQGVAVEIIILAFAVLFIGGIGSLEGAAVGAVIVGFVRVIALIVLPELELALIYIIMIGVLLARPKGLFGKEG